MTVGYFAFDAQGFAIALVGRDFWEENECLDSEGLSEDLESALPDKFYSLQESVYETEYSEDEARALLIKNGWEEKSLF